MCQNLNHYDESTFHASSCSYSSWLAEVTILLAISQVKLAPAGNDIHHAIGVGKHVLNDPPIHWLSVSCWFIRVYLYLNPFNITGLTWLFYQ